VQSTHRMAKLGMMYECYNIFTCVFVSFPSDAQEFVGSCVMAVHSKYFQKPVKNDSMILRLHFIAQTLYVLEINCSTPPHTP